MVVAAIALLVRFAPARIAGRIGREPPELRTDVGRRITSRRGIARSHSDRAAGRERRDHAGGTRLSAQGALLCRRQQVDPRSTRDRRNDAHGRTRRRAAVAATRSARGPGERVCSARRDHPPARRSEPAPNQMELKRERRSVRPSRRLCLEFVPLPTRLAVSSATRSLSAMWRLPERAAAGGSGEACR
jgi:hypothetical protein